MTSQLGLDSTELSYHSGSSTKAMFKQIYDGVPFVNVLATFTIDENSKVMSFGSSFIRPTSVASSIPTVSLNYRTLRYFLLANGLLVPRNYRISLGQMDLLPLFIQYRSEICLERRRSRMKISNEKLQYHVVALPKASLLDGQEMVVEPEDSIASPFGWHGFNNPDDSHTNTTGNDVQCMLERDFSVTAQSSEGLVFDYKYDPTIGSYDSPENLDALRTNAFYVANKFHDVAYRYGFDSSLYNFQQVNYNAESGPSDPIHVVLQDPNFHTNSAWFVGIDDGDYPLMGLPVHPYDFTGSSFILIQPHRHAALANDVMVHEMAHGMTNRMLGEGFFGCLWLLEGAGLGEGWSDAIAEWFGQKSPVDHDWVLGTYLTNNTQGMRKYPYSTDPSINPLRYHNVQDTQDIDSAHNIGEIWANILHNIYADLIRRYEWSNEAYTRPSAPEGNALFMRLIIRSLELVPCVPTFMTARDATLQAGLELAGDELRCSLWKVFASRGMGEKARAFVDDGTVPADCVEA
ncbi:Fungalysin metallopeptidase-domain-containing protein [Crassisporium funariophilum]|nr:Fungalysin metallopeptidase-domain-containing protein [Crassisporium funariophilum]